MLETETEFVTASQLVPETRLAELSSTKLEEVEAGQLTINCVLFVGRIESKLFKRLKRSSQ